MGFLKDTTSDSGITVSNAYHRIGLIEGTQELINFGLSAYPSREVYKNNKSITPLFSKKYSFKPDVSIGSENTFKQAYDYLFTLDEYQDVITILEDE